MIEVRMLRQIALLSSKAKMTLTTLLVLFADFSSLNTTVTNNAGTSCVYAAVS